MVSYAKCQIRKMGNETGGAMEWLPQRCLYFAI